MTFGFHAEFIHSDDLAIRLSFADRNDETGEHYFLMDRSEESREDPLPDMGNIYMERDDQAWGGYGGLECVVLERASLTVQLDPRMATQMGQHDQIRVTFDLKDQEFHKLRAVLRLIMRGYESRLECRT